MSKQKGYDPYDSNHPINVSKRCRPWLTNRLKDGKINESYAENFCIHALMVGKPGANRSRETGSGCGCRLERWMEENEWPKPQGMIYEEWMETFHA